MSDYLVVGEVLGVNDRCKRKPVILDSLVNLLPRMWHKEPLRGSYTCAVEQRGSKRRTRPRQGSFQLIDIKLEYCQEARGVKTATIKPYSH